MSSRAKKLLETFAILKPDLGVDAVDVTPSLYADLDSDYSAFRGHVLISSYEFTEDWPTWERHPAGDEIVLLLSGEATLVLRAESGDESVGLDTPGSYVVVPRNTWHTARVPTQSRMLFITPGEGTENAEEPS